MILNNTLTFFSTTGLALSVLALPLISFLILSFLKSHRTQLATIVSIISLFLSFLASAILFYSNWSVPPSIIEWEWFRLSPDILIELGILINPLTVLMLVVVSLVSFLVHVFSMDYMKDDDGYVRYFGHLGLFTFAMIGIVLSSGLLSLFMFWELVGFSSYLLIGFWFRKPEAAAASKKAFIVNRIGDLGFVLGIMILWSEFHTLDITQLYDIIATNESNNVWLTVAGFCFFAGVMGKSAQFPLLVWLPDAMEGPTPVSALIHAATMVAAGVFLLARLSGILVVDTLNVIAVIGAITLFMGAIAAIHQHDIKKVLAYSTISQLGYMVMGMGVGAFDASIFHLVTHAAFKACLFLSAGAVIYSIHQLGNHQIDAQDMRIMGGMRNKIPITFWVFVVSGLALMGAPFTSGFLSKDAILSGAWHWAVSSESPMAWLVPVIGLIGVGITSFYVSRMLILVFLGKNRIGNENTKIEQIKEPGLRMIIPMLLLGLGSVFILFSFNPISIESAWLMQGLSSGVIPHSTLVPIISTVMIIGGVGYAYYVFNPGGKKVMSYASEPDFTNDWSRLSFSNWHLDSIYELVFIRPFMKVVDLLKLIERRIIDNVVDYSGIFGVVLGKIIGWIDLNFVDGLVGLMAKISNVIGFMTKSLQTGRAQSRIVISVLGIIVILGLMFLF